MQVRLSDLKVEQVPLEMLKPYDGNAKKHTNEQIEAVENSIREFGFKIPVIAWHNDDGIPEIVAGHGRCKAAKNLGMDKVPVIYVDDLSDAQRRALALVDNQTTMMTGWEQGQLDYELDILSGEFDMEDFGFDLTDKDTNEYTDKVKGLIYEPVGIKPGIDDLCDTSIRDRMLDEISNADVSGEELDFLKVACERFVRFRYDRIADYYAQASNEMKAAMEALSLVIIDRGGNIENAAIDLADKLKDTYGEV